MSGRVPLVPPMSRSAIEDVASAFVAKVSPETATGNRMLPIHEVAEFRLAELFGVEFNVGQLPIGIEGRFEGDTLTLNTYVYNELLMGKSRSVYRRT